MNYQFINNHRFLEKVMIRIWLNRQGGEFQSHSLRDYFKEVYKIEAGLYSYGWSNPRLNFGGGNNKDRQLLLNCKWCN